MSDDGFGINGGYFVAQVDDDRFVTLHGPYWDAETAAERFEALDNGTVTLIPVPGITATS